MKNKYNIRLEISSLAESNISGVGMYTKAMAETLDANEKVSLNLTYYNFLNRKKLHSLKVRNSTVHRNVLVPLKIYAKLQSIGLVWPFDIFKCNVDLTIFPNFATWPTIKSKKVATTVHDLTYLYFPETVESKNLEHLKRVVPRTIKNADIVLTVSNSVKNEIVKEFGVDEKKIVVTYNSAGEEFYDVKSEPEISRVKNKYGISENKDYIYFIGNFEPRKNLASLVRAYSMLPTDLKNQYSLVLAGGMGWNSEETDKEINKAKENGDDVLHIGYIDQQDSPALYQGASLFVFPSIYEGFGIPILEAMASSCPVVASDIPVLREAAGDAALYADPKSSEDFSKAIVKILTDKNASKKLVDLGKKNLKRFNWQDNINKILEKIDT